MKLFSIRWQSVEVWTVEAENHSSAARQCGPVLPPHVLHDRTLDVFEIEKREPKVWRYGE